MQTRSIVRWTWAWGLPLAALLVGGTADAAGRYKKGSDVQVQAVAKRATKVEAKKEAAPTRPKLLAEQFRQATAAKVAKLTDQAIATLKRLIKVTEDKDPEKPDFFFRLAEHYREKKNQFMFRARELDESIYQATSDARRGQLKSQQKAYEKAEQQWMIQAIKMYLHIATKPEWEKFKRMDEVLFNVADMLNQANRRDKARIFFAKLIRNYPQSKYIPDAYLSFAEFYFNEGEVVKALKLYEQVGKYPNSPIYGYAVYKQGWCWLNLKDPHRALEMFVKVIKNAGRWGGAKKSKIVLVREAKKDSVRAYSHVGTPEKAWPFFQRIGGNYAMKMLEGLANIYYDQGKFLESVQTYRKLIALNPKSKELCNWQYSIMKATLSGKDKRQQVVESKRLAAVYSAIKGRGDIKKTARAECRSNASGVLRELATTWHREAQKTMNMDTYALAQYLYKEYLDNFPNEKDAYTMSFYYAELLYKLEKWMPAAEAYTKVVKMKPRGKYLKEAAYAAVVSWKNALNVEDETKSVAVKESPRKRKGKKGKKVEEEPVLKPQPIPENQQKMIAAFDTYIRYVPDAPELVPIMYRKARIYYEHNHFDKAVDMFAAIVTKHSGHELAVYAANLLLDSLNALKRFGELNQWVDRLMKDSKLAQGEFLEQLRTLKRGSQRKEAEHLQKTGHYKECGEKYAKIANEYQEDERWAEVLYNAALCFEAAKLIGQAISIRNTLIKIKPKDPLSQKAMYMIGENYHALAWYSRAADYYEQFAKKFPGEAEAPKALQNAIVFRMGRAEYDQAIDDARLFAKNYGTRPKYRNQTAAVMFSLGAVYEGRGEWDRVVKHYNDYLRKWGRHGGQDREVRANVKIGAVLWKQSCPVEGVNGACIKVKRVRAQRKLAKKKRRGKKKRGIEVKQQCGPETKMKVTVVKRNPAKSRKAQQHFAKALTIFKRAAGGKGVKGGDKEEREKRINEMKYAAAEALFFQAEDKFEAFLDVNFPKSLDFSSKNKKKAEKSKKEFGKYLETKGKRLEATRKDYQDVILLKQAHWAIAASARIGQLFQNFADALYTAPIPKPPLDEFFAQLKKKGVSKSQVPRDIQEEFVMNFVDTYCDTLEDKASPLEDKAVQGLATCLSKSTELSWYNEWSKLCERELNQIKPAEYPIASEIRAEPGYVTYTADRANAITVLK